MKPEGYRRFACRVESRGGQVADRMVIAGSADQARVIVESAGDAFLLDCRDASRSGMGSRGRVSDEEATAFLKQWSVLLRAGIPVAQALRDAVSRREGTAVGRVAMAVAAEVEGGRALSDAASCFPSVFPAHFVASIEAAERTATVPEAIARHLEQLSRLREVRRTVIAAATYPALLLVMLVAVSVFFLVSVLPNFAEVYSDSLVQLPAATRILIRASESARRNPILLLAVPVAAAFLLRSTWRSSAGRVWIEQRLLRFPRIGGVVMDLYLSRLTRTLSTLLKGGYPLLEALRVSASAPGSLLLEGRLVAVAARVEGGEALAAALRADGTLPDLAVRLVEAGERGGSLPEMLVEVADWCEEDLRHRVKILTAMLEPLLMILVGAVVGGLVVAIYLPIFQLAGVIG